MSKEMTIIVLGIWVAIVPYIGIPISWRIAILVLSGIAIAIVGFLLRGEALSHSRTHSSARHTFVENVPEHSLSDTSTSAAYLENEQKDGITSLN